MRQISFVMPGTVDQHWTDIAIRNLIGQTCTFTMFEGAQQERGKIIDAQRKAKDPGRGGVWLTIEVIS